MSAKDEFTAGIQQADARIDAIRDALIANGDKPLPEGTWRIRDALSHLAARSNGVARVLARVEAFDRPEAAPPAPRTIDEINAGQVEERTDASVEELLDEIAQGHRAAIMAASQLDEAVLERMLPMGFRPGEATVGELLLMGGPRHEQRHLDQIEAALSA